MWYLGTSTLVRITANLFFYNLLLIVQHKAGVLVSVFLILLWIYKALLMLKHKIDGQAPLEFEAT